MKNTRKPSQTYPREPVGWVEPAKPNAIPKHSTAFNFRRWVTAKA